MNEILFLTKYLFTNACTLEDTIVHFEKTTEVILDAQQEKLTDLTLQQDFFTHKHLNIVNKF